MSEEKMNKDESFIGMNKLVNDDSIDLFSFIPDSIQNQVRSENASKFPMEYLKDIKYCIEQKSNATDMEICYKPLIADILNFFDTYTAGGSAIDTLKAMADNLQNIMEYDIDCDNAALLQCYDNVVTLIRNILSEELNAIVDNVQKLRPLAVAMCADAALKQETIDQINTAIDVSCVVIRVLVIAAAASAAAF
jgi:GTP cyclohydrolase III